MNLTKRLKEANFTKEQQALIIECISHAHMRGVRYGSDPLKDKENIAYIIQELDLLWMCMPGTGS